MSSEVAAQKKGTPIYKARFGVQAYTFRRSFPTDVAKTLDTIKMMGFTEIEGSGGKLPPQNSGNYVRKEVSAFRVQVPDMNSW